MILGIILVIFQILGLIPSLILGENIFAGGLFYLLGKYSFGIVGVILIIRGVRKRIRGYQKKKK